MRRLKREPCCNVEPHTRPDTARNRCGKTKERCRSPYAAADALLEFATCEALSLVVGSTGIEENTDAEPRHAERRRGRNAQLGGTCDHCVANRIARPEASQVP